LKSGEIAENTYRQASSQTRSAGASGRT